MNFEVIKDLNFLGEIYRRHTYILYFSSFIHQSGKTATKNSARNGNEPLDPRFSISYRAAGGAALAARGGGQPTL